MDITLYEPGQIEEQPEEVLAFIYDILYKPFGHAPYDPWRAYISEVESCRVVARSEDGAVIGCARISADNQIKAVATAPAVRGQGVGRALLGMIEEYAASKGASKVHLNARIPAIGFYESLGFSCSGERFISQPSNLPHVFMDKTL